MEMVPYGSRRRTNTVSWHDLGNGTVLNFLDPSKFQYGVFHSVWDDKRNMFTATRHANGKSQLIAHIPRSANFKFGRRQETVSKFVGVWDETVTTSNDDYTQVRHFSSVTARRLSSEIDSNVVNCSG